MRVDGYAALDPGRPLEPFQFERRSPRSTDVQLAIEHCGICHTDIHMARNDWGIAAFPCVPGHEIVGTVTAVGSAVTRFQTGDRVGVGCIVGSCRECASCREGLEQLCEKGPLLTYAAVEADGVSVTYGGYSSDIVVDEHFVFLIPEQLDLASAAPLLCAGITTYSPLRQVNLGRGDTIAVMGLGGLGHMAVQYAASMGADVTVLSRSSGKAKDARALGAANFVDTSEPNALAKYAGHFRYIIDTVAVEHDITTPLTCLQRDGILVMLGISPQPLPINLLPLVFGRRRVMGSLIGGVPETQEMLDYSAAHGIRCQIEEIGPTDINTAFDRILQNDVKYRFVIDCKQMRSAAEPIRIPM